MTATKQSITYTRAESVAADIMALLWPFCERLEVAGSIRRRKHLVSDIELVVEPHIRTVAFDLFGTPMETVNMVDARARELLADGTLEHRLDKNARPAFGERYKRLRHVATGIPLDLFSVLPPAQFGVIVTIRTGSREFSEHLVTSRLIGGALPSYMLVRDGCLYRHINGADLPVGKEQRKGYPAGWLVEIPTPTEASFFEAIGVDWVEPERRS